MMGPVLWLSWKELIGRKSGFFLNAFLVCLAVGLCVSVELFARSREQAVKSRTYYIAPTIKIFPKGVTQSRLLLSGAVESIDQRIVLELESKYNKWIHGASGRLIFKRKINTDDILIVGYDPLKMITPFKTLRDLAGTEAAAGPALGQVIKIRPGDLIRVESSEFRIKDILPSTGTIDDAAVFIPLPEAQSVAKEHNRINEISLYARTGVSVDALIEKLRNDYPDLHIVAIKSGDIADEKMESALKRYRSVLYAMIGGIMLLSLVIVSALNARERKLELATLYSIGASNTGIFAVLSCRSLIVAVLGSTAGCVSSALIVLLGDFDSAKGSVTAWEPFTAAVAAAVIFTVLAALPTAVVSGYRNHVAILQEAQL